MERCIIVGAGEFSLSSWCYEEGDYLIAADGGYDHLQEKGITPDENVELDEKYFENPTQENDNQLQKALYVVNQELKEK